MAKAKHKLTPRQRYYRRHHEEALAKRRAYHIENRDAELKARRDHYAKHREETLAKKRAYYRKNRRRIRARENAAKKRKTACTPKRQAQ